MLLSCRTLGELNQPSFCGCEFLPEVINDGLQFLPRLNRLASHRLSRSVNSIGCKRFPWMSVKREVVIKPRHGQKCAHYGTHPGLNVPKPTNSNPDWKCRPVEPSIRELFAFGQYLGRRGQVLFDSSVFDVNASSGTSLENITITLIDEICRESYCICGSLLRVSDSKVIRAIGCDFIVIPLRRPKWSQQVLGEQWVVARERICYFIEDVTAHASMAGGWMLEAT